MAVTLAVPALEAVKLAEQLAVEPVPLRIQGEPVNEPVTPI